jgi:Tol biopolymer transport system component
MAPESERAIVSTQVKVTPWRAAMGRALASRSAVLVCEMRSIVPRVSVTIVAVAFACAGSAASMSAAVPAGAQRATGGGRLAYDVCIDEDCDQRIYTISEDGSGARALRDGGSPAWSPDGRRIAYEDVGATSGMNADGTHSRQIRGGDWAVEPRWSPDGKWLSLVSTLDVQQFLIVPSGGRGAPRRLRALPAADGVLCYGPIDWSPDGKWLVYSAQVLTATGYDPCSLYVVNLDGSGPLQLTRSPSFSDGDDEDGERWSPDGKMLLFVREGVETSSGGFVDALVVLTIKGGALRVLRTGDIIGASWSPDGRRIAYTGYPVSDHSRRVGIRLFGLRSGHDRLLKLCPQTCEGIDWR